MSEGSGKQPSSKGPNVWAVGFAALFAGYLLGQNGAQPAAPAPPPVSPDLATPATDLSAVDMNATDMNATAVEVAPAADTEPAGDSDTDAGDTASASDFPAYYTPPAAPLPGTPDSGGTRVILPASGGPGDASVATAADASPVASSMPPARFRSADSAPAYSAPGYGSAAPSVGYSASSSKCVGLGCYGAISDVTGLPRTTYVHGYTRRDGTYVQPYYRSSRRR